ncbi:MAG: hypothetical protein HKN62_12110 [Phycisphaerales bacterium]|nr:hypothetical protein [Phycisphaerales bacterium]
MRLLVLLMATLAFAPARANASPTVHSVCDISQTFTFYMDGRFHRQYLAESGRDARNWGSLSRLDLENVNLLVLSEGDRRLPYTPAAIDHVAAYVADGGALLLMADGADPMPPGQAVAERFGVALTTTAAQKPLRGVGDLAGADIVFRRGRTLEIDERWSPLVVDADDRPVLAAARVGDGHVLVGSRGLFGRKPDASDPINAAWVTPMLVTRAETKAIDPARPHRHTRAEGKREIGPLTLEFHAGTEQFADAVHAVYEEVRPHLVAITGVEPSPGMIKSLLILPTGGGGFSSGRRIAIGAWWGNFPERRYPMVELIAHEAGHSWVLPYAEPLWNEPIATYLGIQVGRRLGHPEADETLARQIARARRHDPDLTTIDPLAKDAPRDLVWGKSYFVFEELERRFGPDALAKYFRTKRVTLGPGRNGYSMDDCVAVWSRAVGEDLYPWFQALGFGVDRARTDLAKR